MIFRIIACTITIFLICNTVFANSNSFDLLRNHVAPEKQKQEVKILKNSDTEFQVLFSGLYWFYKEFISSQDQGNCLFYPSCSDYGLQAIQKQGAFIGMMNTFDRLLRCNGLSPELYQIHPNRKQLLDPVQ